MRRPSPPPSRALLTPVQNDVRPTRFAPRIATNTSTHLKPADTSLTASTGKPASTAVTALAERTADNGAIEASVVWKNGSYYYLFSSWDLCCQGTASTYNIRVGRSSRCVLSCLLRVCPFPRAPLFHRALSCRVYGCVTCLY